MLSCKSPTYCLWAKGISKLTKQEQLGAMHRTKRLELHSQSWFKNCLEMIWCLSVYDNLTQKKYGKKNRARYFKIFPDGKKQIIHKLILLWILDNDIFRKYRGIPIFRTLDFSNFPPIRNRFPLGLISANATLDFSTTDFSKQFLFPWEVPKIGIPMHTHKHVSKRFTERRL